MAGRPARQTKRLAATPVTASGHPAIPFAAAVAAADPKVTETQRERTERLIREAQVLVHQTPKAKAKAKKTAAKESPAPRAPKPTGACLCGCGSETKRNFAPGHDARVYGWIRRQEKANLKHIAQANPEVFRAMVARAH